MNDQRAMRKMQQQIFAAPACGQHLALLQQIRQPRRKGPAQSFTAQNDIGHRSPFNMRRNTTPGNLNLRQFWHDNSRGRCY